MMTQTDKGAVLVLVSLVMTVLLGMAALVVDIGALALERREVQNGADAAALAVAQDCALGSCSSATSTAQGALSRNGDNGRATSLTSVCGSDPRRSLRSCGTSTPPRSTGASGWVRVSARSSVDYVLAPLMGPVVGDADARSTAAWGPLGASSVTAWAVSLCEYTELGGNAPRGVFPVGRTYIYFHEPGQNRNDGDRDHEGDGDHDDGGCGTPNGDDHDDDRHESDNPAGGFGWLRPTNGRGCLTDVITVGQWATSKPGASAPNDCSLTSLRDQEVLIALYDADRLQGQNGGYHIVGFVGFRLRGFRFPGSSSNRWPSNFSCPQGSSTTCIYGEFTRVVRGTGDFAGTNYGATVVKFLQ